MRRTDPVEPTPSLSKGMWAGSCSLDGRTGSKKGEGSERVMRGRNENGEREDKEEEEGMTMPVRHENGPQRMLWPCSFCPFP